MQNTPALLVLFSSPSACHSIRAVLLRVTAAMAGAVCGQTLPVVVKAQTISRSAGPLSLCFFFLSAAYCIVMMECKGEREGETEKDKSMKVTKE